MNFQRFSILMVACLACFISTSYAQDNITVSGTVVNQHQDPLSGVSVAAASGAATVTDTDGKFTLATTQGETLTFSYVGYHPATEPDASTMHIEMLPSTAVLDEVVVVGVGYGTMRKSDLTDAITPVSGGALRHRGT